MLTEIQATFLPMNFLNFFNFYSFGEKKKSLLSVSVVHVCCPFDLDSVVFLQVPRSRNVDKYC